MAPRKLKKEKSGKVSFTMPTGPAPPGGPIEIVFSFDTTGSMSSCLQEVRKNVKETIERLFGDIPGLRVAVFAHGDYCDSHNYITKWVDFSNDKNNLVDFVNKVSSTGGGDYEECYELVLRQVRTKLSWTPGTQRSLVMIGDAIPHPKTDPQNKGQIDWKEETQKLRDEGVKIYSVQCMYNDGAAKFWREMAEISGGRHLKLEEFRTITDIIMSICYRETGAEFFNAYEKEVRAREGDKMRSELNLMFDALRDAGVSTATAPTLPGCTSVSFGSPPTPDSTSKLTTKASGSSRKRKGTDTETADDADSTDLVVKKIRTGRVTKKPSLKKKSSLTKNKPSLVKKHSTPAKYVADKLVARARKSKPVSIEMKRCCRENLSSTKFMPDLTWSKWYSAFQMEEPKTRADGWAVRSDAHGSFVHKKLFYHDTKVPGVYELAVQPIEGCKKYPVWHTITGGFNSVHWDTYLTHRPHIQGQLDEVLDNGGKVFVRRGKAATTKPYTINVQVKHPKSGETETAKSMNELRSLMNKVYDYAWSVKGGVKGSRIRHRDLQKKGVQISNSKF